MKNAVALGNNYESDFIDGPLNGVGFPQTLGEQYQVHNIAALGFDGIQREFYPINAGLGSIDLITPRDIGGTSQPPRAVVIDGPVGMDARNYFDFNTDWNDVNPDLSGPTGFADVNTQLYLSYLDSQLQPLTQVQSAEALSYAF